MSAAIRLLGRLVVPPWAHISWCHCQHYNGFNIISFLRSKMMKPKGKFWSHYCSVSTETDAHASHMNCSNIWRVLRINSFFQVTSQEDIWIEIQRIWRLIHTNPTSGIINRIKTYCSKEYNIKFFNFHIITDLL